MILEIAVLERGDPHRLRDGLPLGLRVLRRQVVLSQAGGRTIHRRIDECSQAGQITIAGAQRLPVRAVDGAERVVLEDDGLMRDAALAGGAKDLFEVQRLAGIDHVEHGVGAEIVDTLLYGGEVSGAVEVATV